MPEDVTPQNGTPAPNPDEGSGDGQNPVTQPPSSSSSQDGDNGKPDWYDNLDSEGKAEVAKEAQERGFKSMKDFWKSYREAESKISTQGQKIKDAEKFEQDVAPILDVIYHDDELLNQVRTKLSEKPMQPQNSQPDNNGNNNNDGDNNQPSTDTGARKVLEAQVVKDFETSKGINNLDEDSQAEVRKVIGKYMGRWVEPGKQIPIEKLDSLLEDAYDVAIRRDKKLRETLEAAKKNNPNEGAEFSSQGSGGSQQSGDVKLSPEEEKVAARMPGGREAYIKGKKKILGINK